MNRTIAAKGDDDWRISALDRLSSNHYLSTTNSALDIKYRGPQSGFSPLLRRTSWSMPGWCGGSQSAETLLNKGRNSWYYFGTISSRGHSFESFASIAIIVYYSNALNVVSFPFFTVRQNEDPLGMMIFPRCGSCGCICGLNNPFPLGKTGSGGSFVTPRTMTGASWQCVMQCCDPNGIVLYANHTTTSGCHKERISRTIG